VRLRSALLSTLFRPFNAVVGPYLLTGRAATSWRLQRRWCSTRAESKPPRGPRSKDVTFPSWLEKVVYSVIIASTLLIPFVYKINDPAFKAFTVLYVSYSLLLMWGP
jgi:hypothetical protein